MRGTVKIGGKEVGMLANAASPHYYKQIFKEDFLQRSQEALLLLIQLQLVPAILLKSAPTD